MATADLRRLLYANTMGLVAAVRDAVVRGGASAKPQITSDELERRIVKRRIEIIRPVRQFAVQLMQAPFFKDFARGILKRSQSM
jgi:ribosomal protein S10